MLLLFVYVFCLSLPHIWLRYFVFLVQNLFHWLHRLIGSVAHVLTRLVRFQLQLELRALCFCHDRSGIFFLDLLFSGSSPVGGNGVLVVLSSGLITDSVGW